MESTKPRRSKPKLPPVKVVSAVNRLRSHVSQIHTKMVPPAVAALELMTGMWMARAAGVAAELGVADAMAGGPTDYQKVATKIGAHPDSLYRLLRALSMCGVVKEMRLGTFALTAMGQCFRTDHPDSIRDMVIFQTKHNWAHWAELTYSIKTGKCALQKVRGMPAFEYAKTDKEAWDVFDRAMTNISRMESDAIVAAYSFANAGTVADVGGGHGAFLATILEGNPKTRGILYDMPEVIAGARHVEPFKDRCRVLGGDFFRDAPEGADIYTMKHIIHDWSDEESWQILKNVRARIKPAGKLLLLEAVIPPPNEKHFSKWLDLEMLVVTTGRERTQAEYAALLAKGGFRLTRIVPTVSTASVIEAVPA